MALLFTSNKDLFWTDFRCRPGSVTPLWFCQLWDVKLENTYLILFIIYLFIYYFLFIFKNKTKKKSFFKEMMKLMLILEWYCSKKADWNVFTNEVLRQIWRCLGQQNHVTFSRSMTCIISYNLILVCLVTFPKGLNTLNERVTWIRLK